MSIVFCHLNGVRSNPFPNLLCLLLAKVTNRVSVTANFLRLLLYTASAFVGAQSRDHRSLVVKLGPVALSHITLLDDRRLCLVYRFTPVSVERLNCRRRLVLLLLLLQLQYLKLLLLVIGQNGWLFALLHHLSADQVLR